MKIGKLNGLASQPRRVASSPDKSTHNITGSRTIASAPEKTRLQSRLAKQQPQKQYVARVASWASAKARQAKIRSDEQKHQAHSARTGKTPLQRAIQSAHPDAHRARCCDSSGHFN